MAQITKNGGYQSLEDRFLSDAHELMKAQNDETLNPNGSTVINTLNYNGANNTYTITATIPVATTTNGQGKVVVDAQEVFLTPEPEIEEDEETETETEVVD